MKLILGLHMAAGLLIRLYYSWKFRKTGEYKIIRRGEISAWIITLGLILTFILTLFWILRPRWLDSGQLRYRGLYGVLGMFFLALHLFLLTLSHRALGPFWSGFIALKTNHSVIRQGIYRYLKHPMYLGVICWILGLWFCCQNLWFLFLLILALGIIIRIPREEKLLEQAEEEYSS